MLQVKPRFQSFEDYLAYDDGSDKLYELFNGELIEVPPESGFNVELANFLFAVFLARVGHRRVRGHGLELEVHGEPKNRYPDLTIIRPEHIEQLQRRNTIRLTMSPPLLVVEVVSPGSVQRDRDYIAKRGQYEAVGIPEYWLVDPQRQEILVLALIAGVYQQAGLFTGQQVVQSSQFGAMGFTVAELFTDD
ncbi:MAG: Uma2 family endonuclease [Spirulina sp. SIO3F2]|nr:Uma2 family endonuclease [Spirulina sp. SIO3F2]